MNARVLRIQEIDLNKINYVKVKDIDSKKQIFIEYENKPLVFQCPSLFNNNLPIKITDDYYELEIPLIAQDKNKKNSLINFFKKVDSKIVNDANNNVKLWFNENKMSYFFKTIIKDSETYKEGTIKLKIIKTIKFESILFLENDKKINIKDIPKESWVKILLEFHSIIINNENKTFYLFLKPHAFSFNEQKVKLNYNFLEDSDSDDDILYSDINNLFLKQTKNDKSIKFNENQSSSQINYDIKKLKNTEVKSNSNFSSTSSSEKSTKKINEDSNEKSNEKSNKDSNKDSNEESNKDSNEDSNSKEDSNKESNKDSNKESNKDSNKESNKDSNEDSNSKEESNKDSDEESNKDSEEESNKDSEEASNKDSKEKSIESLNKLSDSTESLTKLSDSTESLNKLQDSKKINENNNLLDSINLASLLNHN